MVKIITDTLFASTKDETFSKEDLLLEERIALRGANPILLEPILHISSCHSSINNFEV